MTARTDSQGDTEMIWTHIKENWIVFYDHAGQERWAWPDIMQYTDGADVADTPDMLPDGPEAGYRHVVHDLEAKEMLDATGLLYDGRHRGGWVKFNDRRNAPAA